MRGSKRKYVHLQEIRTKMLLPLIIFLTVTAEQNKTWTPVGEQAIADMQIGRLTLLLDAYFITRVSKR